MNSDVMNTNLHAFLVILKRELRAIVQERTILIAFLIQLFVASFSSVLFIGLMSVYNPQAMGLTAGLRLDVGLMGDTEGALAAALREQKITVTPFASLEDATRAFHGGAISAAILLPEATEEGHPSEGEAAVEARLFLPRSKTHATMIMLVLHPALKQYENVLRERNGIHLRYTDLEGELSTAYEFRYGVILPLLMFFPAFVTGGLVIDGISEELVNRTLDTLWSGPLSLNAIFSAKIATALILSGVQCALWLTLLRFNQVVIQNAGLVLLMGVVSAAIVAVVAALTTIYFKDREQSQFVYAIFILLSTGLSYLTDLSPIALVTRLSSGDPYAGLDEVAIYVGLLLLLLGVFFSMTRKLLAASPA